MPLYYKNNGDWTEFNPNPYPIGTVVFNQDNDVSPASLVGGTWNKIDSGGTLDIVNHLDSTIIKNINITLNNRGVVTGSFDVYSGSFPTSHCIVIDNRWDVILLSGFPIPNNNIVLKTDVSVGGSGRYDRDCSIVLQTDGCVHLVFSKIVSGAGTRLLIEDHIGRININYSSNTVDPFANFFLYKRTA